ncbi:unnamed protein product [Lasius platythorax]|uniref:Uncharacterized protein n=1 Tax=Lasius platythorax TaxID=488582 RepID=A0AAV2NC12_9HYME
MRNSMALSQGSAIEGHGPAWKSQQQSASIASITAKRQGAIATRCPNFAYCAMQNTRRSTIISNIDQCATQPKIT